MNSNKLKELESQFNIYYAAAQTARSKNDFYNLVIELRRAAQCQLDMTEFAPPEKKGPFLARGKDLLEKAKMWEEAHPECFANTNMSKGGQDGTKHTSVSKVGTTFDDIVGCDDVKKFVEKQYIKRFSDEYKIVFDEGRGGSLERGMLLFGLPGTGKTMIARAIANAVDAEFLAVKASDLKDRFYGETERKIRELYEEAAKNKLTIIFIDEIETLLPSRSGDIQNHESSAVTEFLTVLDGFEKEKMSHIITIAASNYPGRIDAAAIRPGRLGAWFRVDLPNADLRRTLIMKHFSRGYSFDSSALDFAVQKTKGYSSADVVALCDRIKAKLADDGIAAIDKGYNETMVVAASSTVNIGAVESVLSTSNSSVSKSSIEELAMFEENYNYRCKNGGIIEFMKNLT